MKQGKSFDCLEMKNRIQREMREEEERLGSEEVRRRRDQWLWESDDPLACWWRSLSPPVVAGMPAAVVREDSP